MSKRDVVMDALAFRRPAYVPWSVVLTTQNAEKVKKYLGVDDLTGFLDPHFLSVEATIDRFDRVDENHVRDLYGVLWDRTVDKDIGTPCQWPIKEPEDLDSYEWPDPSDDRWYGEIPGALAAAGDLFRRFSIGFCLYERAWTMHGMSEFMMDMIARPEFAERFLDVIVEHNLVRIRRALEMDVDCIHFGDDYGMQTGLIHGIDHWRRFFKPRWARMWQPIREAGKVISMHSCGRVQELFDDLVEIGLNMFNPFQPEVMDVFKAMRDYRGRLAFHGGMSVQKILPFGTKKDVREQTRRLLDAGRDGGYVFAPSHDVPYDVPPENIVAMMEVLKAQSGIEN